MAAPVATNVFKPSGVSPRSPATRVRSARNGVAAWTKLTPKRRIVSRPTSASHTSWSTCGTPRRMAIHIPYRKPVWWASGEGT